jgi:dihydroorotase
MSKSTLIYNAHLVDKNIDSNGAVLINNGLIEAVYLGDFSTEDKAKSIAPNAELFNAEKKTVMPSFIDMHVHFRYPGQTQKEDLDTGLSAAVVGGFGTVVLMPNTNPVVSSAELALKIKEEAESKNLCQVFQTMSLTRDFGGKDTSHLDEIDSEKIPVISEDGHDVESTAVMAEAMAKAAKNGVIVSCHSEDVTLALAAKPFRAKAIELMKSGEASDEVNKEIDENLSEANAILALAEDVATERNIALARFTGSRVHIAHCSTARSIDAVRRAKEEGLLVTAEVTPHHFGLTDADSHRSLVNPPLRSESDRIALIDSLRDGTADVISTDHAPHTASDKANGAPGFVGLETAFAVSNSVLVKEEHFTMSKLSELMSANPAEILGLNKGLLRSGLRADLVLIDENERWTVHGENFKSKGKASCFEGKTLSGKVKATWFGGNLVYQE